MKVRRFAVTDLYEVKHVYFISVGQSTRVASSRQCWRCGTEFDCVPDGYNEFLPDAVAEELPLDEVARRSNPPLADLRAKRRQLQDMAREPAEAPATQLMLPGTPLREVAASTHDEELREALRQLEACEGRPEVTELFQELQNWRSLDSAGRSALLREVFTFIDEDQKTNRAVEFFNKMVHGYPRFLGCLPAAVVLAVLGPGFWWLHGRQPWLVCSYLLFFLVAVFASYFYATKAIRRRWIRKTVIPAADDAGVNLPKLVWVMDRVARMIDQVDDKLGEMAADAGLLKEEAIALGCWEAISSEKQQVLE